MDQAEALAVEPLRIWTSESTLVTVTGRNFANSPALACSLNAGKLSVPAKWIDSTHAVCEVTIDHPGTVFIRVSNNGEDWGDAGIAIIAESKPLVSDVMPDSDNVQDAVVTGLKPISGDSSGGSNVIIVGTWMSSSCQCAFGFSSRSEARYITSTSIGCVAPPAG